MTNREIDLLGEPITPVRDINTSIRFHRVADLSIKDRITQSGTFDEHDPGEYHAALFGNNRTLNILENVPRDDLVPRIIGTGLYYPGVDVYIQKVPEPDKYTRPLEFS